MVDIYNIPSYDVSDYMLDKDRRNLLIKDKGFCHFAGIDTLGQLMFLDDHSDVILLTRDEVLELFIQNNFYKDFNTYIGVGDILDNL